MQLGVVNEKALSELGWPALTAELSRRARTPMGRERCGALLPGDDPEEAHRRLALIEETRALRRLDREVPLADALDLRPALGRAAREGTLEPQELLAVARLVRASASARRFCLAMQQVAPLHAQRAESLSDLEPLAAELERAFDPSGKLLDTASAVLAELRERARGLHRAIKSQLEEMLADEEVVGMLRDAYYSVRGDRYVLPVRAEHKSHLPGIVHNASGSGPNAGGKTVTITAVGLSALMARAGLPVPAAEGSRVPLYRTVYTAIGDEGDLSRDLSTFTAHLTALKHILEAAGPGTLVLIDEIAA